VCGCTSSDHTAGTAAKRELLQKALAALEKESPSAPANGKDTLPESLEARRALVRQQCRFAGIPAAAVTTEFVETCATATGKRQMLQLIEDRRAILKGERPREHAAVSSFDEFTAAIGAKPVRRSAAGEPKSAFDHFVEQIQSDE
jgi:hypothetical protein